MKKNEHEWGSQIVLVNLGCYNNSLRNLPRVRLNHRMELWILSEMRRWKLSQRNFKLYFPMMPNNKLFNSSLNFCRKSGWLGRENKITRLETRSNNKSNGLWFIIWSQRNGRRFPNKKFWLSWLERHLVHLKVVSSFPDWVHAGGNQWVFLSPTPSPFPSPSLSAHSSPPCCKINKNVLGWGLKKRNSYFFVLDWYIQKYKNLLNG